MRRFPHRIQKYIFYLQGYFFMWLQRWSFPLKVDWPITWHHEPSYSTRLFPCLFFIENRSSSRTANLGFPAVIYVRTSIRASYLRREGALCECLGVLALFVVAVFILPVDIILTISVWWQVNKCAFQRILTKRRHVITHCQLSLRLLSNKKSFLPCFLSCRGWLHTYGSYSSGRVPSSTPTAVLRISPLRQDQSY